MKNNTFLKIKFLLAILFFSLTFHLSNSICVDSLNSCQDKSLNFRIIRSGGFSWGVRPFGVQGNIDSKSIPEVLSSLEQTNYYWDMLGDTAKEEIIHRLQVLDLESFTDRLIVWLHSSMRGAVTGDFKNETIDKIKDEISSVILKGSYVWGFKRESPFEESTVPNDFDMVLILEDSGIYKAVHRKLSPTEKAYLFGDNPRAPPEITFRIIGDKVIEEAIRNYTNPDSIPIVLTLMSNRGAGITLAGEEWALGEPPVWAWHASIKDMIGAAQYLRRLYFEHSLTEEERQEYNLLEATPELRAENDERYRELKMKYETEQYYHFKLIKRILEASARIQFFQRSNYFEVDELYEQYVGDTVSTIINIMIEEGVTENTQDFFLNPQLLRDGFLKILDYITEWVQKLEDQLISSNIELIDFDREGLSYSGRRGHP